MDKKLYVLKGFERSFIEEFDQEPLIKNSLDDKIDIRILNDDYKRELMSRLLVFTGFKFATYEEFVLIQELGEEFIRLAQVEIIILKNLVYPDYYPVDLIDEGMSTLLDLAYSYFNTSSEEFEIDEELSNLLRFYGNIKYIDGKYYISYKNQERVLDNIRTIEYPESLEANVLRKLEKTTNVRTEIIFEINSEIESYLRIVESLNSQVFKSVGIKINDQLYFNKYLQQNFNALVNKFNDIKFMIVSDTVSAKTYRKDFDEYLEDIWGYSSFKELQVYQNPDENKDVISVSQGQIIEDIVNQAEKAFNKENFQDVFITAPTGAGKSIIFQLSALYLANKYDKLTIIISPLIALMKDQIKNLHKNNIENAAYINSELNFIEKENVLQKIRSKEIDILYISPETLLSYTIENFIGDREIGLFIIDEAHIVTTWGKGFRPDYWYLGKYLSRVRSKNQIFPIVTFTATAVYGGNDDMYDETIESLNMKSTIKYLGRVKRDDISFDINVDLNPKSKEQYENDKIEKMLSRFNEYLYKNKKVISYFPYASIAESISYDKHFSAIKDKFTVYTGRLHKTQKDISEKDFSGGEKPIMLATKAFGMGIDISNIEVVYHYAPTGNLNDYVQEIGRAARDESIKGTACIDFMTKDFKFVNMLFGMSSIKQYQAKAVLKKLYNVYSKREKQNFLVTPNDFSYIFSKDSKSGPDDLERKIKTVLLMLEKDLEQSYGFPVLISRPKSMFSKAFVVLDKDVDQEIRDSKYGIYFDRIQNGRNNHKEGACTVTDFGDIYLFNLRKLWEDHFPEMSFASFKYHVFSKSDELKFNYSKNIHLRYKIGIQTKNGLKIKDLKNQLALEIDKINRILDNYKDSGKMFTVQEFASDINQIYNNREKAHAIASSYIDLISPITDQGKFIQRAIEFNSSFNKYRIINRTYNMVKRDIIYKSDIIRRLDTDDDHLNLFYPKSNKKDFDLFRGLYLLEIFDLASYEILGGESPEIFVRLNDPLKVRRLTSENFNYRNEILQAVKKRHENSTKILRKFFVDLKTDVERWDFIEDYFLGYDLVDDIENVAIED